MFLAGDACHIVPPTGANGLNLAASDVHYLSHAWREYYDEKSAAGLERLLGQGAGASVESGAVSWWMTSMLHKFPDEGEFGARISDRRAGLSRQFESRLRLAVGELCGATVLAGVIPAKAGIQYAWAVRFFTDAGGYWVTRPSAQLRTRR